jgi:hypothetical protein
MNVLAPYLPRPGSESSYIEGGSLYALGLINAHLGTLLPTSLFLVCGQDTYSHFHKLLHLMFSFSLFHQNFFHFIKSLNYSIERVTDIFFLFWERS